MLGDINRESKAVELEMNLSKTQIMFNELIDKQYQVIKIDDTILKVVNSYIYLGQIITT